MLFIHGHESANHQTRNIFDELKDRKWLNKDYYSVNKFGLLTAGVGDIPMHDHLNFLWDKYFRKYLKRDPPKKLICDCCAQFVISRDMILKYPKEAYESWLNLLINDYKNYSHVFTPSHISPISHGKQVAMMFEYIWHIIFGQPDEMTEL